MKRKLMPRSFTIQSQRSKFYFKAEELINLSHNRCYTCTSAETYIPKLLCLLIFIYKMKISTEKQGFIMMPSTCM